MDCRSKRQSAFTSNGCAVTNLPIEPYDENDLQGADRVVRRIHPVYHIVPDENTGKSRVSSKAFNKSSGLTDGMSVDVEKLMQSAGIDPKRYVSTPVFTGSVSFSVAAIRKLGLWVGYDPIYGVPGQSDNPYHGEVWARDLRRSFSDSQKTGLRSIASWYVQIPGVDLG